MIVISYACRHPLHLTQLTNTENALPRAAACLRRCGVERRFPRALLLGATTGDDVPKGDATPRQAFLFFVNLFRLCRTVRPASSPLILCIPLCLFSLLSHLLSCRTVSRHFAQDNLASMHSRNLRCAILFWIFLLSFGSLIELQSSSGDADDCAEVDDAACDMVATRQGSLLKLPTVHITFLSRRPGVIHMLSSVPTMPTPVGQLNACGRCDYNGYKTPMSHMIVKKRS